MMRAAYLSLFLLLITVAAGAQNAVVSGIVSDVNGKPIVRESPPLRQDKRFRAGNKNGPPARRRPVVVIFATIEGILPPLALDSTP